EVAQPKSAFDLESIAIELDQSGRREPRGFDEQWAANAASPQESGSNDFFGTPDQLDALSARRFVYQDSPRPRHKRARGGAWFAVIAGGASVGALLLYLFITLSGIGPPKEFAVVQKATLFGATKQDDRKEAAWLRFYNPSDTCRADANRG